MESAEDELMEDGISMQDFNEAFLDGEQGDEIEIDAKSDELIEDTLGDEITEADNNGERTIVKNKGPLKFLSMVEALAELGGKPFAPGMTTALVELAEKVDSWKRANGMGEIKVVFVDSLSYTPKGSDTPRSFSGVYFNNRTKNQATIVINKGSFQENLETTAHEFIHPYFNFLLGTVLEGTPGGEAYAAKIESIMGEVRHAIDIEIRRMLRNQAPKNEELLAALNGYFVRVGGEELYYGDETQLDGVNNRGEATFGVYGLTNRQEFISEAFGKVDFARILNAITSNQEQGQTQQSILYRIINAIAKAIESAGIKVRKHSILGKLSTVMAELEQLANNPASITGELSNAEHSLLFKKAAEQTSKRKTSLWNKIKGSKVLTTQKALNDLIDVTNTKLPEEHRITEKEREWLNDKFKKSNLETKIDNGLDRLKKRSNLKEHTFKESGELKSRVAVIRAALDEINTRLTMTHTAESDAKAQARLDELTAPDKTLTEKEQDELDYLRFELAHTENLDTVRRLNADLEKIIEGGKTLRRMKVEKRKAREESERQKILQSVTNSEIPSTPHKGSKEYKAKIAKEKTRLGKAKRLFSQESSAIASFSSLMHRIAGVFDKTRTSETSAMHKLYVDPELKANIAKTKAVQGDQKAVYDKIYELFIKDTLSDTDRKQVEATLGDKTIASTKRELAVKNAEFQEKLNEENIPITFFAEEGHEKAGEEITNTYSPSQMMTIWAWQQDTGTRRNFLAGGYGADFMNQVDEWMDANPAYKQFMEWTLEEFLPEMHGRINEVYQERNDMDLPLIAKYFPLVYDYTALNEKDRKGVMETDNHAIRSVQKRNLKARTPNSQELDFTKGALSIIDTHINNSEHYIAYDALISRMRNTLSSAEVRNAIRYYHSDVTNDAITYFIDNFANKNVLESVASNMLDEVRKRMYPVMLGVKPIIYAKQMVSAANYSVHMPEDSEMGWVEHQVKGRVPGTEANKDKKWAIGKIKRMPMMIKRAQRGGRTLSDYQTTTDKFFGEQSGKKTISEMSMALIKAGDMGAIIEGGWPVYVEVYNKAIDQGMSEKGAEAAAEFEFVRVTLETQQSTETANMSQFQLSKNALTRFAGAFVTTPMQYARKVNMAAKTMVTTKDKRIRAKATRTFIMYGIIQPALFEMVSQAFIGLFTDDDEKQEELLKRVAFAPFSSYFTGSGIVGQLFQAGTRKAVLGGTGVGAPLYADIVGDMMDASQAIAKFSFDDEKELTDKEFVKLLNAIGLALKLPVGNAYSMGKGGVEALDGGNIMKLFGYSGYALGENVKSGGKSSGSRGGRRAPTRRAPTRRAPKRRR
jgi:hypothetical protein